MDEEPDEARQRVDRAIDDLDKTIRDIRNFIFGLRPELLKGMTLAAGLDALVEEFRVNTMVDVELLAGAAHDLELPGDMTGQLLIITREALSNVARHAKASRATVEFIDAEDRLAIAVADNGTGFEVGRRRGPGHQGILNMRHRAAGIGGTLEVESRAGSGTRIIVTLPRPDAASGGEG
jgi:signal transduction histidine kinase